MKAGSMGRPLPGWDVRLLDENEQEVAVGDAGEIHARSPSVMAGYLPDEADAEVASPTPAMRSASFSFCFAAARRPSPGIAS